jgi:hypothetical protein
MPEPPIDRMRLFAEVEDLLRTCPQTAEEIDPWIGRAAAVVARWNPVKSVHFDRLAETFMGPRTRESDAAFRQMMSVLHQAHHDLRMRTTGPLNAVVSSGRVFEYFDNLRKIIELAGVDLLFVDPYLDADFVSSYLPHAQQGAAIRLLTSDRKLSALVPAVERFAQQENRSVTIRQRNDIHDRCVFVDQRECYQSGASFKDGAKNAPTTLTQMVDAFAAVHQTYEELWDGAQVVR